MGLLIRLVLSAGGGLAAFFIARDSPNFEVVSAMFGLAISVLVLVALGLWRGR
ncbi:hypothetical protein M0638_17260 [Roseomonas sp. NAR14]|uniref:Uncharacterized protein n=1 Tax=Roseomonas acroporae TaxID=2937791 RepID=A0A9X1Y9R2_9PROT|nr:hypothetical protein [Roseomonas acroporae]MCK8786126.1 hypothetical protein [Roseomonas acroporae]